MPRRLTQRLLILAVLIVAFAVVSVAPATASASSMGRKIVICWDAPLEYGCTGGYWCCDGDGNCYCG